MSKCAAPGCWRHAKANGRFCAGHDWISALMATQRAPQEHDTAWRAQAACRGLPAEMFFPGKGEDAKAALAVCRGCSVREPCLAAGEHEEHGVWGGRRADQRRRRRAS